MDIIINGSEYFDAVTIANLGTVGTVYAEQPGNEVHVVPISAPTDFLLNMLPVDSVNGSIAHLVDGADGVEVKSCVAEIEPVQDLSNGNPSPTNICPITGHNSVSVVRMGVNVWGEEWDVGDLDTTTGAEVTSTKFVRSSFVRVIGGNTYFWSSPYGGTRLFYDENKEFLSYTYPTANTTFTVPNGASYMRFRLPQVYGTTYNNDVSVNYPSTDTTYHAYQGTTYTQSFPSTVYGGSIDLTTGVLTVDRAIVDLGTLAWTEYGGQDGLFYSDAINAQIGATDGNQTHGICNKYLIVTNNSHNGSSGTATELPNMCGRFRNSDGRLYFRNTAYNGQGGNAFKTAMSGAYLVYELATPTTTTLTPQQITTLLGTNNFISSTGDTSVTYRANIQLYIDKEIADAISAL